MSVPYKIACLCYLFDEAGRVLLLHRIKPPNRHLYSPIGGKLETGVGESPTACAAREIWEEAGLRVPAADLHLTGIVSEAAFGEGDAATHWLMFLYEVTRPVPTSTADFVMDEGGLEWLDRDAVMELPLPETDRAVIWPEFWRHRGGFFTAHIDCTGPELAWTLEQSRPADALSASLDPAQPG